MYALVISTNRRNKDQEKTKKQIQQNKTKQNREQKIMKYKTQKITKGGEPGSPVVRGCYVLSSCGSGLLHVSSFIIGSLCVEGMCVPGYCLWGLEREKKCENSLVLSP